ncbi:MAG: hypothetical protein ABR586_00985 [Thermoplasmatota archaeon]
MVPSRLLLALALAACGALPAAAGPPGNVVYSWRALAGPSPDLKDGAGVVDPTDAANPCTTLLHGAQTQTGPQGDWPAHLGIATNLDGPAVGVSRLSPPLAPAGGWLPGSGGVPLGIPCPLPGSGAGSLWLVWSGMDWHAGKDETFTEFDLCLQLGFFALPGVGCFPGTANLRVVASACTDWPAATFTHDYADQKGEEINGIPWDRLATKSDALSCPVRHSHNYTADVTDLGNFRAAFGDRLIKNADLVHPGTGTTYVAVCWHLEYLLFTDPQHWPPIPYVAEGHDWFLVVDHADPLGPANVAAALAAHLGPGAGTTALRGVYSGSETAAGQNGYGPCPTTAPPPPASPKPLPLI